MDGWGNDVITAYALHHLQGDRNAGWIIALQDVWTLKAETLKNLHVAAWAPVDHTPAPPRVIEFFQTFGAVPLAMSRDGFDQLTAGGLKPLYVPHGIETKLFKPMPEVRDEGRKVLGLPKDAYVYGMVANNNGTPYPSRKAFGEVLQAFKVIHERHSDTVLYLHAMRSRMYGGMDIGEVVTALGLDDAVVFVEQFGYTLGEIGTADMPAVYACMDVLVNPAMGEGFGMPIIEAQSCGTPVILADNTAMSELCGAGWLVPSYPEWDGVQRSWWGKVQVSELVEAMEEAYSKGQGVRDDARAFITKDYDADDVTRKFWKPALKTLERLLKAPDAKPVDLKMLEA